MVNLMISDFNTHAHLVGSKEIKGNRRLHMVHCLSKAEYGKES